LTALLFVAGQGCASNTTDPEENTDEAVGAAKTAPPTSFLSADTPTYAWGEEEEEEEEEQELEEGDIYRVMGNGYLLNLNWYRGLQIIDATNVTSPKIIGQLQVGGSPVEMYVDGTRAILLMNDWYGYQGTPNSLDIESRQGGTVMLVDISNPTSPQALAQYNVPGYIQTSRYANGATQDALFVAAGQWDWYIDDWGDWQWTLGSTVKSFEVGATSMTEKSELDLGGFVSAIHAENEVLLVAREKDWWMTSQSDVSVIDISDNGGTMVERDEVTVNGYIRSQFHMDYRND